MICIDTNVLLRYLLQDDDKQAKKANALIEGKRKVLITDIVLVETLWTLKGRKYCLDRKSILLVVEQLFKEPNIVFEDSNAVWQTLQTLTNTELTSANKKNREMDFSDVLIVEKAKRVCVRKGDEYYATYSFDQALQQLDGVMSP
ncbi:MAG: type II toxin-antitoxin system VapC family toxin [Gammaproteobacteria bacterium]|nr:type II toxin-antitoxin system VapC family toxin [Gammaproteobacteria bacterium]